MKKSEFKTVLDNVLGVNPSGTVRATLLENLVTAIEAAGLLPPPALRSNSETNVDYYTNEWDAE